MFEWKVDELKLMNDVKCDNKAYSFEADIPRQDKIDFVDSRTDGRLTYIINLCTKFEKDKDSLKRDRWGNINTNSLKAWLNRNDVNNVCDKRYRYGDITIYKGGFIRFIGDKPLIKKMYYDTFDDIVDEFFHRILKDCEREEIVYYRNHNEYEILKGKVMRYLDKYNIDFGVSIIIGGNNCIEIGNFNNSREFTIEELELLVSKYEYIDSVVDKISNEIDIHY